jgi:stage II sporulation protein D
MRVVEARQWGWGTIPGNDFSAARDDSADGSGWKLEGHSVGHGVGMCQHGAVGMAIAGAQFQEILAYYYPNTVLISSP